MLFDVLVAALNVVFIRSQNYFRRVQLAQEASGEKYFQQNLSFPK